MQSVPDDLKIKVLLVEDDEDDYTLVRSLLSDASPYEFHLVWVRSYEAAVDAVKNNGYDVCLLDFRLGERTGLELLRELNRDSVRTPFILLTGQGDYEVDIEAMQAGAADYLVKDGITTDLLERSIRYALERRRAEEVLRESEGQLKFLSSQLLTVQESERKRIACELHDNLGQVLSAIKFRIESALNHMEQGTASFRSLESLVPLTRHAIDEVRRMYTHLRPTILDDFGIVATIRWLAREFERAHPGTVIEYVCDIPEEAIPEHLKTTIFRIVQEALENVGRHSKAELVNVSFMNRENSFELTIEDNGVGFDLAAALSADPETRGLGITSMKERAELSGGSFTIESTEDVGTIIRASWPVS